MNVDQVVAVLRELVELRAIKRKIELRTATDDERERYKFGKAKAWNDAEAILHDRPLSGAPSSTGPFLTWQPAQTDAWVLYCNAFRDLYGHTAGLELSPAALAHMVDGLRAPS